MKATSIALYTFLGVVIAMIFWWWSAMLPKSISPNSVNDESEVYIASVYSLNGEAVYQRTNTGVVSAVTDGVRLTAGTSLRTFENTHLVLAIGSLQDRLEIGPESEILILIREQTVLISVFRGEVFGSFHNETHNFKYEFSNTRFKAKAENADVMFRILEAGMQRIEVYRGNVKVEMGAKTVELEKDQYVISTKANDLKIAKQGLSILTPLSHDRIHKNTTDANDANAVSPSGVRTRFAWTATEDLKRVEVWLGSQIEKMSPLTLDPIVKKGETTVTMPEGIYYWQLKALTESSKTLLGPVYKIFVETEKPVQLIEPMGAYSQTTMNRLGGVLFRWSNPSKLERLLLEVSTNKDFTSPILRQPVADGTEQLIAKIENVEGDELFWRVNGFRHDTSDLISSAPSLFEIESENSEEPEVLFPSPGQVITQRSLRLGLVFFSWKTVGLNQYEVAISDKQNKTVYSKTVGASQMAVPPLPVGSYKAHFRISGEAAVTRDFEIVNAAELSWRFGRETQKNGSKDAGEIKTVAKLVWESSAKGIPKYRLRISSFFPVQESKTPFKEYTTSKTEFTPDLPEEGLYSVVVQGLDAKSKVLAESDPLIFRWKD